MATFDELIEALETSDDDESVFDALLEDGHPSIAAESEQLAHTAMVNHIQVTAQNDENMDLQMGVLTQLIANMAQSTIDFMNDSSSDEEENIRLNHRWLPRNIKKKYDRDFIIIGLNRDYLGPTPLFDGKEFDTMFEF